MKCLTGRSVEVMWRVIILLLGVFLPFGAEAAQIGTVSRPSQKTCRSNQFSCSATGTSSLRCIPKSWRCDGGNDCAGGEDEKGCPAPSCPSSRFYCSGEKKCMPNSWRCDGDNDCTSGEDEEDCNSIPGLIPNDRQCALLEFKCATGALRCIIGAWKCDGDKDCADGSDELNCSSPNIECPATQFKCEADNNCIPGFLTCSGKAECSDGADEKLDRCHRKKTKCCDLEEGEFACEKFAFKSDCVKLDKICNGVIDCSNSRDESAEICGNYAIVNYCATKGRCGTDPRVTCKNVRTNLASNMNRTVGYACKCPEGFSLVNNECQDKNECIGAEKPVCDQICVNELGSYRCECNDGFSLDPDFRSCKVNKDVIPMLLFSNRHEIRSIQLDGRNTYVSLVDSRSSAVALDFDYAHRQMFYADISERKIFSVNLTDTESDTDLSVIDLKIPGVLKADGLAYDWIYNHLYWTDTSANTVNMACLDDQVKGKKPTTVLYKNQDPECTHVPNITSGNDVCINEPRALVVHPRKGWAFWSDWGAKPHIALGALDGSHMEMIAYNKNPSQQYLLWPNGLTLDLSSENERLYWIDARLHSISSCTINKCISDITVLVYDTRAVKHPFSITVFENKLYWSDWTLKHIASVSKHNGGNMTTIVGNLGQPMDLKVYHPTVQPNSTNHCAQENGSIPKCQQICVPRPWSRSSSADDFSPVALDQPQHRCLCTKGFTLHADGRRCTEEVLFTAPPTVPARPTTTVKATTARATTIAKATVTTTARATVTAKASTTAAATATATGTQPSHAVPTVQASFDTPV